MAFNDVKLNQIMDSNSIVANYQATDFIYNDSISFDNLYFKTSGGNNELESILTWGPKVKDASQIHWYTMVNDVDHYDFNIDPSHFSIKNHVWEIAHSSKVKVLSDTIRVDNLELTRNDQLIKVDGLISKRDDHQLRIDAVNVELDELAGFFTDKYVVIGKMNGWGFMSNPFNNFDFWADAHVQSLAIDGELVGDVYGLSEWNKPDQSVQMSGNLMYRGSQTFNFKGNYYTQLEKDNLQMDLIFDKTDIQFTNAFMDPDVLDEIKGELNGTVKVSGTPSVPELNASA